LTGDSYKSKDEEEAEENEKKKGRENFWKTKKKNHYEFDLSLL
jgi:hypothetical protein